MISTEKKAVAIKANQAHKTDNGSEAVQAAILTERIKEILGGPEQTDRCDTGSKHFEILGKEFLPQLFAEAHQQHRARCSGDVAVNAEQVPRSPGGGCH